MTTTHDRPDNTGKGSGPWECYGCGARLEALDEGFNTTCPYCHSYEIHLSDAAKAAGGPGRRAPRAGDVVSDPGGMWDGAEIISVYTRAQAINDGTLVDVSEAAREVGITYPVAMTRAAYEDCVAWPESNGGLQDERGRLHDVVWMTRCAAQRSAGSDRITVELYRVPNRSHCHAASLTKLVAVCGPGDTPEPVITIMQPGED